MLLFRSIDQAQAHDTALESVAKMALASRVSWYAVGLGCSLGLALALRLVGLTWGFPHEFHIDEEFVISVTQALMGRFNETGSLNPDIASYGALPLYLLGIASAAAAKVIGLTQTFLPLPINSAPPLYVARLLSAIEGLATVWLTAELARRLFGRAVALLTALFLGVCLLPVREAHFGTVDTLLTALISLVLLLGEPIARRGWWQDYVKVGIAVALAAATKIIALLALAPIALAHAWQQMRRPEPERAGWSRQLLPFAATVTLVVALWLALNPYALLDPEIYLDLDRNESLQTQSLVVRGKLPVLYTLQFINETPYLYVLTNLLRWGMGLPLEILALAGVGYSLWRLLRSLHFFGVARGKAEQSRESAGFADAYLLSWLGIYFVIAGSWYAQFVRYALPLTPVLCLLGSRLLVDLWQRPGRTTRTVSAALSAGVFVATLAYTLAYVGIYREPDVRITTVAWLKNHVPPGSSILVEKDEAVFLHRNEYRKAYGLTDYHYRWQVWNPYEIDGVKSVRYQPPAVSEERTRAHLAALLTADYVVISANWRDRFLSAPALFPAQAHFYQRLFSGDSGYRLVRTFNPSPRLGALVWNDESSELTFRLFDHPTIYVFARDSEQRTGDRPSNPKTV